MPTGKLSIPRATGAQAPTSGPHRAALSGEAAAVASLSVDFPGAGTVAFVGPFEGGQRLWLTEGGEVHPGWSPPDL